MNGIIVMDKPTGVTSFKALYIIKRALGTKKVGHTGTLDPDATGVLPVMVGKATSAAELIAASDKEYIARVLLGVRTDTLDMSGSITERAEVNITKQALFEAAEKFTGVIEQIPPMYSAVSKDGVRLYDLARRGIETEREKRTVTVNEIEISDVSLPYFTMRVSCSKGTYIRTLADDMGEYLGTHAAVASLRRTRCGIFTIEDAHTPEEIERDAASLLIPVDRLFSDYEAIRLDSRLSRLIKNGVNAYCGCPLGKKYRLYDDKGDFVALAEIAPTDGKPSFHIIKGFY